LTQPNHPTLDALRALYPHLSLTLYMYAGQPATLEAITPDGKTFKFEGKTEAEAILAGFGEHFTPPAASNVFD
jgi:hypothetical protein